MTWKRKSGRNIKTKVILVPVAHEDISLHSILHLNFEQELPSVLVASKKPSQFNEGYWQQKFLVHRED